MWQVIKALVLGKAVLLTPAPIDIGDKWLRINPPQALTAIDPNAHIEIKLSLPDAVKTSRTSRLDNLSEIYVHGCVRATLVTEKNKELRMKLKYVAVEKKDTYLIIQAPSQVPVTEKFSHLWIKATCPLNHVTVLWRNDGKKPEGE
jgi:hypothetical protein